MRLFDRLGILDEGKAARRTNLQLEMIRKCSLSLLHSFSVIKEIEWHVGCCYFVSFSCLIIREDEETLENFPFGGFLKIRGGESSEKWDCERLFGRSFDVIAVFAPESPRAFVIESPGNGLSQLFCLSSLSSSCDTRGSLPSSCRLLISRQIMLEIAFVIFFRRHI